MTQKTLNRRSRSPDAMCSSVNQPLTKLVTSYNACETYSYLSVTAQTVNGLSFPKKTDLLIMTDKSVAKETYGFFLSVKLHRVAMFFSGNVM